jgi:hypothetical protein
VSQGYGNDLADLLASVAVTVRHSFPHPLAKPNRSRASGEGLPEQWPVARRLGGLCLESQRTGGDEKPPERPLTGQTSLEMIPRTSHAAPVPIQE